MQWKKVFISQLCQHLSFCWSLYEIFFPLTPGLVHWVLGHVELKLFWSFKADLFNFNSFYCLKRRKNTYNYAIITLFRSKMVKKELKPGWINTYWLHCDPSLVVVSEWLALHWLSCGKPGRQGSPFPSKINFFLKLKKN